MKLMSNTQQGEKLMGVLTIGIVISRQEDLKDSINKVPSGRTWGCDWWWIMPCVCLQIEYQGK